MMAMQRCWMSPRHGVRTPHHTTEQPNVVHITNTLNHTPLHNQLFTPQCRQLVTNTGLWCVVVMPTQPHRECSLVVVVGADCPKRVKHAVDAHANRGCRCAGSEAVEVHHHTAFVLLSNKCCGCVWCLLVVSCNNHTMPSTSWSCVPPPTSLMAPLNKHLKPCVLCERVLGTGLTSTPWLCGAPWVVMKRMGLKVLHTPLHPH